MRARALLIAASVALGLPFVTAADDDCEPLEAHHPVDDEGAVVALTAPSTSVPWGRTTGYPTLASGLDYAETWIQIVGVSLTADVNLKYEFTGSSEWDADVVLPNETLSEREDGGAEWDFEVVACDAIIVRIFANVRNPMETPDIKATLTVED